MLLMHGKNQIKIAISGKRRTGKDTVALLIAKHLGLSSEEYKISGFADKIKETFKTMMPWIDDEHLYGKSELRENLVSKNNRFEDGDGKNLTVRRGLTDIGKLGRLYNPNLWVIHLNNDFIASQDKRLYIITDIRMINEFDYAKKLGFYTIRIKRTVKDNNVSSDISEIEQEEIPDSAFDTIIQNDYSFETLSDSVGQMVSKVRLK